MTTISIETDGFIVPSHVNAEDIVGRHNAYRVAQEIFFANLPEDVLTDWEKFNEGIGRTANRPLSDFSKDKELSIEVHHRKIQNPEGIVAILGVARSYSEETIRRNQENARRHSEGWHDVHDAGYTDISFYDHFDRDARPLVQAHYTTQMGSGHPGNFSGPKIFSVAELTDEQLKAPYLHDREIATAAVKLLLSQLISTE